MALEAAKDTARHRCGNGIYDKALLVETPSECASVLIDCLVALPSDDPIDPNYMKPKDVARILSKSDDTVRRWINARELKASNLASKESTRPDWYITRANLDTFIDSREPEAKNNGKARRRASTSGSFKRY